MQLAMQHHGFGHGTEFLKMRRLHMRLVGLCVDIHLEHTDAPRVTFFRRSMEGNDPGFRQAGLRVFESGLVEGIEPGMVDVELCKSHHRCRGRLSERGLGQREDQQRCAEQRHLPEGFRGVNV
ncbi:hypothetical protein D3C87_1647160 [compost metagenome]